jgi:hypothetical protein
MNCPFFIATEASNAPSWRSERPDARDYGEFVAELLAAFGETIDDAVARGKAARRYSSPSQWKDCWTRAVAHLVGAANVHNQSAGA